jgi:hypothetical protein
MFKYLIFIINFIGYLIFSWFGEPISVSLQAPEDATVGTTITVNVTINKGNKQGFGNFRQELPIGYTASEGNIPLGTFTFKDQRVVVGWLNLPNDSIITFSYKISIDPTAEGPLFLSGTFNFIENNDRKSVEAPSVSVNIRPTGFVAQTNDTTSHNNQQITSNATTEFRLENVFCYRQVVKDNDGYTVSFLVNTANLPRDKFAKIQEIVPAGYTATALETNEGIFSNKDNTIKFLWMSLPVQKQFVVSYKLVPTTPGSIEPNLTGSLSYIENESTKIKTIQNHDFLNASIMATVQEQKQATKLTSQVTQQQTTQQQNNQQQTTQTNKQKTTQQQNNQQQTTQTNKQKTNQHQNNQQQTTQTNKQKTNQQQNNQQQTTQTNQQQSNQQKNKTNQQQNNQTTQIPTPDTGVKFRVQIAAGHRPVNPHYYFKQFNVNEKVQMEQHEGWHKYTVGLFSAYKEARNKRVEVWQSTSIHDAFVSAYNNGSRITVQEALMIANQKWVQ